MRRALPGWGAFTTPLTVVVLFVAGAAWTLALAAGMLSAAAFTGAWLACRIDRPA